MIKEFKHFNKHEQKMLNLLYRARIKLSSLAIANRLRMHWTTVEDNLSELENRGWVTREDLANKTLWQFNFDAYYELKKQ